MAVSETHDAETQDGANRVETFALTAIFAAVSSTLLMLLPMQTRSGPENAGWWTQPWLMPSIALSILVIANLISLLRDAVALRRAPPTVAEKTDAWQQAAGWFRPLEFFAYFMGYLGLLGYLGYFLSTALFLQFLLYRVGLRTAKWRLMGLLAAICMTAIFRWGLGVWVPTAELYDFFPDAVRKFLTRWF
jgi:protein-S-isoprenylcysteine O-methyltransferase Ste14